MLVYWRPITQRGLMKNREFYSYASCLSDGIFIPLNASNSQVRVLGFLELFENKLEDN